GRVVLVGGEPGVGKSRLAAELARAAHGDGARVLYGRCDERSLIPYQPFVEALDHHVAHAPLDELRSQTAHGGEKLARLVPALGERLPGLPDTAPGDPQIDRYLAFESVARLLSGLSRRSALLLVIDDLHLADRPTLLLLRHLLRSSKRSSLLVLGTYRESAVGASHQLSETTVELHREGLLERIRLDGLEERELAGLIAAWGGADAPPGLTRAIHDQTEGNLFFVGEFLRHLTDTGALSREHGRLTLTRPLDVVGVPESVKEAIGWHLSRLDDHVLDMLRLASVLGRRFSLDVLAALADSEGGELERAIETAAAEGVVEEEPGAIGQYAFAHALIRDTLYSAIGSPRRARLHRRVGEIIEQLPTADPGTRLAELAYHFSRAAPIGAAEQAVAHCRRAGDHAMTLFAYEEAAQHYRRALQALELVEIGDEDERRELLLGLGEAQDRRTQSSELGSTATIR
ncbi:MAG: AAA family ATPase, partial [Solirubrobacterales bacterium]|nr:AAA family ATPase [Solirubrobacterales bacterium]